MREAWRPAFPLRALAEGVGGVGGGDPARTREYSTFDLFPTTLSALGATFDGDKLGLGVDLYGSTDTLVEELGVADLSRKLQRHSEFLDGFSGESIGEDDLARIAEKAELQAREQGLGSVQFYTFMQGLLSPEFIERACVVATDTRTGESKTFDMDVVPDANDPNVFRMMADTPYHMDDVPYLEATLTVSVSGIEDYPIATLEH